MTHLMLHVFLPSFTGFVLGVAAAWIFFKVALPKSLKFMLALLFLTAAAINSGWLHFHPCDPTP